MKSLVQIIRAGLPLAALGIASPQPSAAAFSEPPLVLYGKVLHVGQGGNYQLYTGELRFRLVANADPGRVLDHAVPLRRVGDQDEFSYRVEVPQRVLPEPEELGDSLEVHHLAATYRVESIRVDGHDAGLLDASQLPELVTSFAHRAGQYRLDLIVNLPQADEDGDGLPDWWEDEHGLNRHSAGDAGADPDGDGLTNGKEFLGGTDPNTANHVPQVQTTSLLVPAGGTAGVFLGIVDQDTDPSDLRLRLREETPGLTWRAGGNVLGADDSFSYATVLAGGVTVEVAPDFDEAIVQLSLQDRSAEDAPETDFPLQVRVFSPIRRTGAVPAIWLDAASVDNAGRVAEWTDTSGENRDGYQAATAARPARTGEGAVAFEGEQFLYLDDQGLELSEFTALLAFTWSGQSSADQTLFSSPNVQVRIGGDGTPGQAHSLTVTQAGRRVAGPVLEPGEAYRLILESSDAGSSVRMAEEGLFPSVLAGADPVSTFMTLGALAPFSAGGAREFLHGTIRELLVYRTPLDVVPRSRIEDYQRSRWEGATVWDYRLTTFPANITAGIGARHILRGGWGPDELRGGELADVLSGGPGNDRLTGGRAADRFEVSAADGDEVITDFSLEEEDVLDLTSIFGARAGLPSRYVRVRTRVSRGDDDVPRVDSILELDHDGVGADADQAIILEGLAVGASDLPRLVGEGRIRLGGPRYETSVTLAAEAMELIETGHGWTVTVERTGNLDAALEVSLTFTGTATIDHDYVVEGAAGDGVVRTVSFGRGQAAAALRLIPMPDAEAESEVTELQVIPSPLLTRVPERPLALGLEDAPVLSIYTVQAAEPHRAVPGVVEIVRTGRLEAPLEIGLELGGTLLNGRDYDLLPAAVSLAAGQTSRRIELQATAAQALPNDLAAYIEIRVAPDPTQYAIRWPAEAVVMVLPEGTQPSPAFNEWRRAHFPDDDTPDLGRRDADADRLTNLQEYILGTNPHEPDDPRLAHLSIGATPGGFELRLVTMNSLSDAILTIETTDNLFDWRDAVADFRAQLSWRPDGKIERRYQSRDGAVLPAGFYRWTAALRTLP